MNDTPKVEEILQLNFFLYNIDFLDGELYGELLCRSIQRNEKSVKILNYNKHVCYDSNINAFFKVHPWSTYDTSNTGNLGRLLDTCSERAKHIYLKNIYELGETASDNVM